MEPGDVLLMQMKEWNNIEFHWLIFIFIVYYVL